MKKKWPGTSMMINISSSMRLSKPSRWNDLRVPGGPHGGGGSDKSTLESCSQLSCEAYSFIASPSYYKAYSFIASPSYQKHINKIWRFCHPPWLLLIDVASIRLQSGHISVSMPKIKKIKAPCFFYFLKLKKAKCLYFYDFLTKSLDI